MLRHGGSQPRKEEGASHHARRGKNAEAFLKAAAVFGKEKSGIHLKMHCAAARSGRKTREFMIQKDVKIRTIRTK